MIAHRFTCGERKVWQNIKTSENIMQFIVDVDIDVDNTINQKRAIKVKVFEE